MDRHLQNKLQQFSATPPESVWQGIAAALDEENFANRLLQYNEAPPATAWKTIESALDKAVPAKVVPFTTRFRKPLRYAAVACFLAVVLVTITLSVKRTEAGSLDPETGSTAKTESATGVNPSTEHPSLPAAPEKNTEPNNTTTNITTAQKTTTVPFSAAEERSGTALVEKNHNKTKSADPVYSTMNEYVVFSDGDGKLRKVSKKLASFVNCKDNDLPCKQRLRELRQRMAASAMTTDFAGVLDLLRHLQ